MIDAKSDAVRTGKTFIQHPFDPYGFEPRLTRQLIAARSHVHIGRLISEAIADGRAYHVVVSSCEETESLYIPHNTARFITYSVTIALAKAEEALIGELAVATTGHTDGTTVIMNDGHLRTFENKGEYMRRIR